MHRQRLPGKSGSYIFRQKSPLERQAWLAQAFIEEIAIHEAVLFNLIDLLCRDLTEGYWKS